MADSHVDPKGHVNFNKNYITKKTIEHHNVAKKVPRAFKKSIQTVQKFPNGQADFLRYNCVF